MASPALNPRRPRGSKAATPAASNGAVGISQRYAMMDAMFSL
jgi:hypothetical protein